MKPEAGLRPRYGWKTLKRAGMHELPARSTSAIDMGGSQAERKAGVEVGRVGNGLHLHGGSLDFVASLEAQRGRFERGAPGRSRVGELEVRPRNRLDGDEEVVLAARRGVENAPRRDLAERQRGQLEQRVGVSARALKFRGANEMTQRRGPFGERPG